MRRIIGFWKRQNLKKKFLLIAIPSAVFSSVVIMAAALLIFQAYEKSMYNMTVQNLNLIIRHIETELNEVDKVSINIITDPAVQRALKPDKPNVRKREASLDYLRLAQSMHQVMRDQIQRNSTIISVSIFVDEEWYYVGNTRRSLNASLLPDMREGIPKDSSKIFWYADSYPADHLYGVRSVKDLYYHTFEDEAVLVVEYDLKGSIASILKNSANVRYSPGLVVLSGDNYLYSDLEAIPKEQLSLADGSDYDTVSINGHKYFTACLDTSDYGWRYAFFILYDNLFGAMRLLKFFFLVMAMVMILISVLYCEKLMALIVNRFTHLTRRMKTVEEGNFQTEAKNTICQGDELEAVCERFERMVGHVDQLIQDNYVKQMLIRENQLKVLQNQINPHFLFNTLQTISWKARESRQEAISYIAEALGKLLRYTLREENDPAILEEEVDILMNYVTIQKTRYAERLVIEVNIPESAKKQKVPKLVLQSLVENAIKHGLEVMLEPCHIHICVLDETSVLRILVSDNGPGIDPNVLEEEQGAGGCADTGRLAGCGIGLKNIRLRLKLLFGEESELLLYNTGNGTSVEVCIVKERGC